MSIDIDCGVCRLRPWRRGDEASLVAHANDREVWLNLRDRFPHPYTHDDARAWIKIAPSHADTSMAIEVDGEAAGGIGFERHDDVERVSMEIGYWLGRKFWGRGIATAAVKAATAYAFEKFDITRVYALPFDRNVASIRVLEKAGFQREGVLRRSAVKDGVVLDQVMFAITDK